MAQISSSPRYETLREELAAQFPSGIDAFCGTVGGAGMVMGVSCVLKSKWPDTRVVVLEPAACPVTTEGRTGSRSVEGKGIGFVPPHLDSKLYDEVRGISEAEGRARCTRLAREEDLLVGTSTALNVVAAIALAKERGPGKTVVTVAVYTGLKYMNGNLLVDA
ncbi:cysteine synthase [Aspergillus piperis CBS 112811]|uniref:Cysteine synthase n=1 Tax=Aspergillus piperis CBS 112811 TaxID=1448313 RepID=A0A8G1R4B0_9EURO|nr:cysteine synthase [Aspergillus piperis CBS 112811]RAH59308.1 cysteine synthase [Aspergillus piperis CBS 112811]